MRRRRVYSFVMRRRLRLGWILAIWLFPAALTIDLASCNDGSTGCCFVCPECACGDMCVSCSYRCTAPKGCYCGMSTPLTRAALEQSRAAAMSLPPDGGDRE
jgi:hypothetical protein